MVPLTTSSIYVFGKQFGTTSLTVTGERGQVMAVVDLGREFQHRRAEGAGCTIWCRGRASRCGLLMTGWC